MSGASSTAIGGGGKSPNRSAIGGKAQLVADQRRQLQRLETRLRRAIRSRDAYLERLAGGGESVPLQPMAHRRSRSTGPQKRGHQRAVSNRRKDEQQTAMAELTSQFQPEKRANSLGRDRTQRRNRVHLLEGREEERQTGEEEQIGQLVRQLPSLLAQLETSCHFWDSPSSTRRIAGQHVDRLGLLRPIDPPAHYGIMLDSDLPDMEQRLEEIRQNLAQLRQSRLSQPTSEYFRSTSRAAGPRPFPSGGYSLPPAATGTQQTHLAKWRPSAPTWLGTGQRKAELPSLVQIRARLLHMEWHVEQRIQKLLERRRTTTADWANRGPAEAGQHGIGSRWQQEDDLGGWMGRKLARGERIPSDERRPADGRPMPVVGQQTGHKGGANGQQTGHKVGGILRNEPIPPRTLVNELKPSQSPMSAARPNNPVPVDQQPQQKQQELAALSPGIVVFDSVRPLAFGGGPGTAEVADGVGQKVPTTASNSQGETAQNVPPPVAANSILVNAPPAVSARQQDQQFQQMLQMLKNPPRRFELSSSSSSSSASPSVQRKMSKENIASETQQQEEREKTVMEQQKHSPAQPTAAGLHGGGQKQGKMMYSLGAREEQQSDSDSDFFK